MATFIDKVVPALTDPLTAKEKESGLYSPPPSPRIVFTGTLTDAQAFFQTTTPVANCRNCPIAKWTDGLPIIIPTEEAVKEMLTGTSHKPDEQIKQQADVPGMFGAAKKGDLVVFAGGYYATVEKVATVAVMAGCKPEDMPVVLAVATTGGGSTNCPGTSSAAATWFIVSGPIAKEIGMNAGQDAADVGNPPNMTIGRVGALMTVNFGQCITGVSRTDAGNFIHSVAFAEDVDGLPTGWEGFNEDFGYKKTESVIGKSFTTWSMVQQYAPSSFRGLIGEGYGGMARRIGVEGKPGPHNFLEYVCPLIIPTAFGGVTFIMHPNMAKSLYDDGFKTKAAVYQWMFDTYFITVADIEKYGWYDFFTAGGMAIEPTTGKAWKDLPKDMKIHAFGSISPSVMGAAPPPSSKDNCIIVSIGFNDELCYEMSGRPSAYPIDPWK